MIVEASLQEDVDVIGLSILSGTHKEYSSRIINLLKNKGADDIAVIVGGIIPTEDYPSLTEMGVKGVFGPGTNTQTIVDFIKTIVGS